jgi:uncharacterized repeat protein (TIGR02543 family)
MTITHARKHVKKILLALTSLLAAVTMVAFGSTAAFAATVDVGGLAGDFSNTSNILEPAVVGDSHRYDNVYLGVDAILTVTHITTSGSVDILDEFGHSNTQEQWVNSTLTLDAADGETQYVTYKFEFLAHGTNTPVTLRNVKIFVSDVDNEQFVQFTGISSYKISANPDVSKLTPHTHSDDATIAAGSYRFQSTSDDTNASDPLNWVEVGYSAVDSLEVNLGAIVNGGAYFSIDFEPATWDSTTTTTVTPAATPYTITYNGNLNTDGSAPTSAGATGTQNVLGNSGSLSKTDLCFQGWNTAQDGSGATYIPGSSITPTSDITLYAKWGASDCFTESSSAAGTLAQTGLSDRILPLGVTAFVLGFGIVAMMVWLRRRSERS